MTKLTIRFDDAIRYAHDAHRAQGAQRHAHVDICHVASIAPDDGGAKTRYRALHDAAEDQGDAIV
jgi:hypothetical protein